MYELKTKETENSVIEFIEAIDSVKKEKTLINYWIFLRKQPIILQKCGDQALLGLVLIIINTRQDTRGMHH